MRASRGDDNEKWLGAFANALFDFRPESRPVFWRLLAVQSVLYRAIARTRRHTDDSPGLDPRQVYDWLRFDADLLAQFSIPEAEEPEGVAEVVDKYLQLYVRPESDAKKVASMRADPA